MGNAGAFGLPSGNDFVGLRLVALLRFLRRHERGGVLLFFRRLRPCGKGRTMIPRPVAWRVRFLRDGKTVAEVKVVTVSRLFARLLALEEFPQGYAIGMRLVVSRMK